MEKQYKSLRVSEQAHKTAKALAAFSGMGVFEYMDKLLSKENREQAEKWLSDAKKQEAE